MQLMGRLRTFSAKEMDCVVENLNGTPKPIRERFPAAFPDLVEHPVDQRNELVHNYEHGVKRPVNWWRVWRTINEIYPVLQQALEDAINSQTCPERLSKRNAA